MDFLNSIKDNQLLMTLFGIGGAGIITFWIRNVPIVIFNFLKRQLTTEVLITNQHTIFYIILQWIEKEYSIKKFRNLKINNGKYGHDGLISSVGYGSHFIRYKNHWLLLILENITANQTSQEKEQLKIIKLGRSTNLFVQLLEDAQKQNEDHLSTKIFQYNEFWSHTRSQYKRELDSVFLEQDKKDLLISTINNFSYKEDWYIKNGIPYQLGILLYGPPGTGKTSLVKAIAAYLNYSIYYISPSFLSKIQNAISTIPNKSILVIEDIDSNEVVHNREDRLLHESLELSMNTYNISDILNSLDGFCSAHGRILIATTNHIEKIDPAIIRPGRIDIKINVDFINKEILVDFIYRFFKYKPIIKNKIKNNITVAELQSMLLQESSANSIIEFCTI